MSSHHQHHAHPAPAGRVGVPGLLYGSAGLAFTVVLHGIGLYRRADTWLFDLLSVPLFNRGIPDLPSVSLRVLCAAIFCYGVAYAILDSAALWRRMVLGLTAVVLTLAMIPAFAVWNVYFSPFIQIVGVFWSWFCVVIYTRHHHMPCDQSDVDLQISAPEPELLVPLDHAPSEPVVIQKKTQPTTEKIEVEKKTNPEDKYKP